jgi:hypothetical protein
MKEKKTLILPLKRQSQTNAQFYSKFNTTFLIPGLIFRDRHGEINLHS